MKFVFNENDSDCDVVPQTSKSGQESGFKVILGLIFILLGIVGNTFAGNINLSSGSSSEFGQGILTAVACDTNGVYVKPINEMTGSFSGSDFRISAIEISDISPECSNRKMILRIYNSQTSSPLTVASELREIAFVFIPGASQTSGAVSITDANQAVTLRPLIPSALSSEVATFTLESSHAFEGLTGRIDSTFGAPAVFTQSIGRSDTCHEALEDKDGNLYSLCKSRSGSNFQGVISKYNRDGLLDNSFATSGVLRMNSTGYLVDGALDRLGNLYLAYQTLGASQEILLRKVDSAGITQNSFGISGEVAYVAPGGNRSSIGALIVDRNEKILVAGFTCDDNLNICKPFVTRFHMNGTLDYSFGTNGSSLINTSVSVYGNAVAVDSAGRIYLCGDSADGSIGDGYIFRLLSNGKLDSSFGTSGTAMFDFGSVDESLLDIKIRPRGGVYVAGYTTISGQARILLANVTEDGSLNPSFGSSGIVTLTPDASLPVWSTSMAVSGNGDIYLNVFDYSNNSSPRKAFVGRVTKTGSLDTTFGTNGFLRISLTAGGTESANSILITRDERLGVVGYTGIVGSALQGFLVKVN